MRYYFAILFAALVLRACGTAPVTSNKPSPAATNASEPQKTSIGPIAEFLLTSAAADFHDHRPPDPARFRNVRIGHVAGTDGKDQYRMCGEFLPKDKEGTDEWVSFATIKTSGYEQYLGGGGLSYCQSPPVIWDNVGDMSSALQSKLDALR